MDRGGPTIVAEPAPGRKEVCTKRQTRPDFHRHSGSCAGAAVAHRYPWRAKCAIQGAPAAPVRGPYTGQPGCV